MEELARTLGAELKCLGRVFAKSVVRIVFTGRTPLSGTLQTEGENPATGDVQAESKDFNRMVSAIQLAMRFV